VTEQEVYSALGEEGFQNLIGAFYRRVATDDVLGPLYPKEDLAGAERRLRDFLIYRFGGPARYIEERGHPRLRMRHAPFPVDERARDRWMQLMREAMDENAVAPEVRSILEQYFTNTAAQMVNRQ
jgi:hemoglobin